MFLHLPIVLLKLESERFKLIFKLVQVNTNEISWQGAFCLVIMVKCDMISDGIILGKV